MKSTDYSIIDHLVTTGTMRDPVDVLKDRIEFGRKWLKHYFIQMPGYTKTFRREYGDHYVIGVEPDHERNRLEHELRINTAAEDVRRWFHAGDVYKLSGVIVSCPEIWGEKLKEWRELTGKEWEDKE